MAQVLGGGALAKLVLAGADAALEIGDHGAQVVCQDLELRHPVQHPRQHDPRHRRAGLVRPAEGPPNLVAGFVFGRVVGHLLAARGVQEDRPVEALGGLEDRLELRVVQRRAVDVGVELHADGAAVGREQPLELGHGGVGRVHRQGGQKAGEAVAVARDQVGQAVVGQPREVGHRLGAAHRLQRRHPQRDHLPVVVEPVHDAEPLVEVIDAGNALHAGVDVAAGAVEVLHPVPEAGGEEVVERVKVLHAVSFFQLSAGAAARIDGTMGQGCAGSASGFHAGAAAPVLPGAVIAFARVGIGQAGLDQVDLAIAEEGDRPQAAGVELQLGVHFQVDGCIDRLAHRTADHGRAVAAHQRAGAAVQHFGEIGAHPFRRDQQVGVAETVLRVPDGDVLAQDAAGMQQRAQPGLGDRERDHAVRMAVNHGLHIGPLRVKRAVDEAFQERLAAVVHRRAVEFEFHDVVVLDQVGRDGAGHQEVGPFGMAGADMAEGVADTLGCQDAAAGDHVVDHGGKFSICLLPFRRRAPCRDTVSTGDCMSIS